MRLSRAMVVVLTCLAAVAGLLLGRYWLGVDLALVLATALLLVLARRTRLVLPALLLLALCAGIWRGSQVRLQRQVVENLYYHKLEFVATVADDPSLNEKGHLIYNVRDVYWGDLKLPGQVRVRSHYTSLMRGYRVKLKGELEPWGYGTQTAQIGFASVQTLSTERGWLENLRQRFFAGMRTALPEPVASMALGLLVGIRALIPESLQEILRLVGLSHIVAVSGYNLTIIVEGVRKSLGRYSRYWSTAVALWLVVGFMLMTGMSAAIVRAGVVSVLTIAAAFYGLRFKPLTLIALAASATAFINPDYVLKDLGWQLSFLAFFGILVLAPLIRQRFIPKAGLLAGILLETLCAQLLTLPLILAVFGQLSRTAPISNLLILPLVPLAMLLSFVAGVAGMLVPLASAWLALPAKWVLTLMLWLATEIAGWEGPRGKLTASSYQTWGLYVAIAALALVLYLATRRRRTRSVI